MSARRVAIGLGMGVITLIGPMLGGGCFPPALPQADGEDLLDLLDEVDGLGSDVAPEVRQDAEPAPSDVSEVIDLQGPDASPDASEDADPIDPDDPEPSPLDAPRGVVASTDRALDVVVQWLPVSGALAYRIVRCQAEEQGACLDEQRDEHEVGAATTTWTDTRAEGPGALVAPTLGASTDRSDGVSLSWSEVSPSPPPFYRYEVFALDARGPGSGSEPVWGRRAPTPVLRYELSVADGPWVDMGLVREGFDDEAGPGTIAAPEIEASQGTYAEFVRLSRTAEATASPGPSRSYRVRAVTAVAVGPSAQASGRRAVGALRHQWERSLDETASAFEPIHGASAAVHDDPQAPAGGVLRYYRLRAEADGALAVWSEPRAGWRMGPQAPPAGVSATTTLSDRVTVSWNEVLGATGYFVYADGVKLNQNPIQLTYYDHFAAPAPGSYAAPSNLSATTTLTDRVDLSWTTPSRPLGTPVSYTVRAVNQAGEGHASNAVTGRRAALPIASYEVEVGWTGVPTQWINTGSSNTSWSHPEAPAGTINAGTIAVTQGDHRAHVQLTHSGGGTSVGATVSYQVRGVLQDGTRTAISSAATGRRAIGALTRQWQRRSGTGNFSDLAGATGATFKDTTAPALGDKRFYRLVLSATGASPVTTAALEGWRLAFKFVRGGGYATCAIDTTGRLWVWGRNSYYAIGSLVPWKRADGPFVDCASGGEGADDPIDMGYGCARSPTGQLFCGSFLSAASGLVEQTALGTGVKSVSISDYHACAVRGDGRVQCWGGNYEGQLGNNGGSSPTPVFVVLANGQQLSGVAQVTTGWMHSCAVTDARSAWCWGDNSFGQLGDGTTSYRYHAVAVSGLTDAVQIEAGMGHTCARLGSQQLRCWGRNWAGQLGDGTTTDRWTPVIVRQSINPNVTLTGALQLAAGGGTTCARQSGGLVCWGQDTPHGSVGNGEPRANVSLPHPVSTLGSTSWLGGGQHNNAAWFCAIADGAIWCWGHNDVGTLGDNTTTSRSAPVQVVLP